MAETRSVTLLSSNNIGDKMMEEITNKELAEDLENVLFDLTNGQVYEGIKYLEDIITYLKKEKSDGKS